MLFRNLFKLAAIALTMLTFAVFFSVSTIYCQVSKQKGKQSTNVVYVKTNKKVLQLIQTWNEKIWFFTSKTNPIKSLAGLNKGDIAGYGAEHMSRFFDFLDAAGIKYEQRSMNILGTGYPIFSGMENPPRLFITWSAYAKDLKGGVRVKFIGQDSPRSKVPLTIEITKTDLTKQGQDIVVELVPGINSSGEFALVPKKKTITPNEGFVLALIEVNVSNKSKIKIKCEGAKLTGKTLEGEPVSMWSFGGDAYYTLASSSWELSANESRIEKLMAVVKEDVKGISIRYGDGAPVRARFPQLARNRD